MLTYADVCHFGYTMTASSFDAQAIANVFHALAVLDMRDEPAMQLIDHMASTILRSRQTAMAAHDFNAQVNRVSLALLVQKYKY